MNTRAEVEYTYADGLAYTVRRSGLFGGVIKHLWYAYAASAERDLYTYGYDRASNRLYRENTLTAGRDELYGYDRNSGGIYFRNARAGL